jgi:hypothetical protein
MIAPATFSARQNGVAPLAQLWAREFLDCHIVAMQLCDNMSRILDITILEVCRAVICSFEVERFARQEV